MALKSISLRGFRNLEPTSVDFAEGSNYLFGPNGAGKTNLLEAIHYLAIGRSFRRCPDTDMLGFGRDVLAVSGTDESGDTAEIRFDGREKRILRNNIPVEKLSEYLTLIIVKPRQRVLSASKKASLLSSATSASAARNLPSTCA